LSRYLSLLLLFSIGCAAYSQKQPSVSAAPSTTATPSDPSGPGLTNLVEGYLAGNSLTTARESVLLGYAAGTHITGNGTGPDDMITVMIGSLAGANLTNLGGADVMIGQKSGLNDLDAREDVFIGIHSATQLTTSSGNVIVGSGAMNAPAAANATAERNVLIGLNVGYGSVAGDKQNNVGIGSYALSNMATTTGNTAVGAYAGNTTTGYNNTAIGLSAGAGTTGFENVAVGANVGRALVSGWSNVMVGSPAPLDTGAFNIMVGANTGGGIHAGNWNVILGQGAGQNSGDISEAILIGRGAGFSSTRGSQIMIGNSAGAMMTSGNTNTLIGSLAGANLVTGSNNTALGDQALVELNGGESNDVAVGGGAQVAAGVSNAIQIGLGENSLPGTIQYLNHTFADSNGRLYSSFHTPTSSSEACPAGSFWDDANFHYVCVATNTIRRVALSAF
jgi:hypothetical protein